MDNQKLIQPGITLGSLFDGIGGFPYAASFFGIKTLWASEIMPQAISVTLRHLPEMEHVGDLTALRGDKLPPVDIISFGSPCQDLSVAGKRAGLDGERSGLFSEAIRIIDEMRYATHGIYPRYAIWENVPGALSSGNPRGSDFQAVLEAFTKTEVPIPDTGGWANAGMVRGGGVDLAWCVYNAQHFGVPQRRRRIFLVCDFGGGSAGEILFIPKSLSGYFAARRAQGQVFAADALRGADGASLSANVKNTAATIFAGYGNHWNGNAGAYDGGNFALSPAPDEPGAVTQMAFACNQRDEVRDLHDLSSALCAHPTVKQQTFIAKNCLNPWDTQQSRVFAEDGQSPTLAGADGGGGRNPGGLVIQDAEPKAAAFLGGAGAKARSIGYSETTSPTLKGEPCGFSSPCCVTVLNDQGGDSFNVEKTEISPTLRSETHGNLPIVAVSEAIPINTQIATRHNALGENTGFGIGNDGDPAYTLQEAHSHAIAVGVHQNQDGDIHTSESAYSLATNGNATGRNAPLVCENMKAFSLDGLNSNSMKSPNPLSGCRMTEIARTLDTTNPCPSKNQGGVAVVESAAGLTSKGNGDSFILPECHYTLTCGGGMPGQGYPAALVGVHPDVSGTLMASGAGMSRPAGMASETDLCVAYCLQGNMIGRQDHNGPRGGGVNEDVSFTLNTIDQHAVAATFCRQRCDLFKEDGVASTQTARQCKEATDIVCQKAAAVDCRNLCETEEVSGTLQAKAQGYSLNYQNPVRSGYIVRRLLPVECERLQGYPDGWTKYGHDGTEISDTRRYQMLGNSVAVPCVAYIMLGIAEQFRKEAV